MNKVALFLSIPVIILGTIGTVQAQGASANSLETLRMVVEARNAARICGFGTSDELDELKHYSALSEIAAAKATSAADVLATRAAADARSPSCGNREQQQVQFVLDASRQAVSGGKGRTPVPPTTTAQVEPLEPVSRRGFASGGMAAQMQPVEPQPTAVPAFDSRDPFARYGSQVRGYFLERKCNFLDYNTELDYWKRLTARYKVMVGEYGRKRVNAAQVAGEKAAESISCSRPVRQLINESYRDLASVSRL